MSKKPFGNIKRGALHRALGEKQDEPLKKELLQKIVNAEIGDVVDGHTVTTKLKRRAGFALNARKWHH